MVIRPIEYSKTFEVRDPFKGVSYWEKMTIGGDISETDNIQDCLQQLKDEVENFHKKSLQPISIVADNVPVPEVQIEKEPEGKLTKEQRQILEIESCTEIKVLESYKLIVKKFPYLQEAYDKTFNKLQNN